MLCVQARAPWTVRSCLWHHKLSADSDDVIRGQILRHTHTFLLNTCHPSATCSRESYTSCNDTLRSSQCTFSRCKDVDSEVIIIRGFKHQNPRIKWPVRRGHYLLDPCTLVRLWYTTCNDTLRSSPSTIRSVNKLTVRLEIIRGFRRWNPRMKWGVGHSIPCYAWERTSRQPHQHSQCSALKPKHCECEASCHMR